MSKAFITIRGFGELPTHPSVSLELESRLGLGFELEIREGRVSLCLLALHKQTVSERANTI